VAETKACLRQAGTKGNKQVFQRKRLMKVEMQFFAYFFSATAKKVRAPRLMKVGKAAFSFAATAWCLTFFLLWQKK
jgi:hypothetical protein